MNVARKIQDEPTAVPACLAAEIPEPERATLGPGMGPARTPAVLATTASESAAGPGRGARERCRCGHEEADHRPDTHACLDDDCGCTELRLHRYTPAATPRRKAYGSREQSQKRHAAIVEAYVGGAGTAALAQRYGLTQEAIRCVLRKAGVIRRPGPRGAP